MEIINALWKLADFLFSIFGPALFYGVIIAGIYHAFRMHYPKKKKPQKEELNIGDTIEVLKD